MSASSSPEPAIDRSHRRRHRRGRLGAVSLLLVAVTAACQLPVHQWVPDFNGDGAITEDEVVRQREAIARELVAAVEAERRHVQLHPFLTCVRRHESDRGGAYPYTGGYAAQNPTSTASGAYQFLDSTWRNVSVRAGYPGYARAVLAPWYVQDAVALWLYRNGGRSAWAGTGC